MHKFRLILASLAFTAVACQSAHADRIAAPRMPVPSPIVTPQEAPYDVTIVGEDGRELDTYTHRKRFYVHGQPGQRYSIRVNNPTNRRVEAVVAVDGVDVIDGETANFRTKRGYIVPPRGSVTIDGFRVSTQAVAAFRFSSVSNSYAGRKGKARNVGVIGVAIFEEKAQAAIIVPRGDRIGWDQPRNRGFDERSKKSSRRPARPSSKPRPAPDFDDMSEDMGSAEATSGLGSSIAPSTSRGLGIRGKEAPRRERPGLGTAFGENRSSAVRFTQFQRANPRKPTSIAELRYNNSQGLQALGIRLRPSGLVDDNELAIRESASSFPDSPLSGRFAKPPR